MRAPCALRFRPAAPDDLERLVDIHASAFPDERDRDARARHLTRNAFGGLEDMWVATDRDVPVGHAFLYALEAWFGGARARVGGVATLGVAPEARGRGVGPALMDHLHEVARARGDAVTALYPFRQAFYAKLGYAPARAYRRLRLAPSSIPWRVELRARAADASDRDAMRSCWEACGLRRTGMLVRGERIWEARVLDERRVWLVVEGARGVEGYIAWTLSAGERGAPVTLDVREAAALTPAAERSLWGLLAAQRDQVAQVRVDVAADDPIDAALVDPDRAGPGEAGFDPTAHVIGQVVSGPSLRLVDVSRALAARGWREDGRLRVQTD